MMTGKKILLSIDVGTTNWKVAAFDTQGNTVAISKTPTITHYDKNQNSFYKPNEIWNSVKGLIGDVIKKCDGHIVGISATSMAEAVVPIDKDGNECFDIITWFDTRSISQAQKIVNMLGKKKIYDITGLDPNPIFSLCKMLWMKENHTDAYESSVKWLQMTDYIIYKLTGVVATDYTLASRTLAFDVVKNKWSKEILDTVGVDIDLLPEIVESGTVIGNVCKKASEEIGLRTDIPVVMGGNDHPCAALPAGVLNGNKILDSSGTAESIILVSKPNQKPNMVFNGQRTCRFLEKSRLALWGGIISSGAAFEWVYKTLVSSNEWNIKQDDYDYSFVLDQVKDVPAGSNGLIFIPHLRGSGAPYWNPKMKGSFLGLRTTSSQKELLKSVMEGLSFSAKMIVDMHENIAGSKSDALCVVGGSGKNLVWQQIKADILQKPIEICSESEATALGAAMLAGVGAGVYEDMVDATLKIATNNRVIEPNNDFKNYYEDLYEVYKLAYDSTVEISERLHQVK